MSGKLLPGSPRNSLPGGSGAAQGPCSSIWLFPNVLFFSQVSCRRLPPALFINKKEVIMINYNELDPKVRRLVKVLNENGIHTTSSCEGHITPDLNEAWNLPYIDFEPPEEHKLKILLHSLMCDRFPFNLCWIVEVRLDHKNRLLYALTLAAQRLPGNMLFRAHEDLERIAESLDYHFKHGICL